MKTPKYLQVEMPIIWRVKSAKLIEKTETCTKISIETTNFMLAFAWFELAAKMFLFGVKTLLRITYREATDAQEK